MYVCHCKPMITHVEFDHVIMIPCKQEYSKVLSANSVAYLNLDSAISG